ncbi:MAG TPA: flagellar protein FlgN [Thauera sp.]|jgi:flagella synthesis protein FlgN|nr:flagellar protein FlgN [Thauera sp.]HRA80709.1 flagellar protein FlgN [Thauera sp.]
MSHAPTAPSPADQQRLALLIEAEAIQLQAFIEILDQEEALLIEGDTDALLALTQKKNDCYRQLQRLHADRGLLLGRLGRTPGDASIRELCSALPRVLARWDEVLGLAGKARDRNEINGKLILERMAHNQAALSALLAAADHPQLYDADGHTRATGGGRILGSA